MKILALETSTHRASLAFCCAGSLVWEATFEAQRRLTSDLANRVAEAVALHGAPDCIAVGLGPGSYAGVRVAIGTAVGLAAVWGCDVLGIPSVVAFGPPLESFQVVGDARRGSWYYSQVESGVCSRGPLLAATVEELRLLMESGKGPVWASEAMDAGGAYPRVGLPDAAVLCALVAARRGEMAEGELEPVYLREPSITKAVRLIG